MNDTKNFTYGRTVAEFDVETGLDIHVNPSPENRAVDINLDRIVPARSSSRGACDEGSQVLATVPQARGSLAELEMTSEQLLRIKEKTKLAVTFGLFSTGYGTLSGAIGSAILRSAGYDYNIREATQASAAGSASLSCFLLLIIVTSCKDFDKILEQDYEDIRLNEFGFLCAASSLAGHAVFSGLIGAAELGCESMTLNQYAAAPAVGFTLAFIATLIAILISKHTAESTCCPNAVM